MSDDIINDQLHTLKINKISPKSIIPLQKFGAIGKEIQTAIQQNESVLVFTDNAKGNKLLKSMVAHCVTLGVRPIYIGWPKQLVNWESEERYYISDEVRIKYHVIINSTFLSDFKYDNSVMADVYSFLLYCKDNNVPVSTVTDLESPSAMKAQYPKYFINILLDGSKVVKI
jgi:hypothetical protein